MQQHKPNEADPMIVMGQVAGALGILGWVRLKTFTEYVDSLCDHPVWWLGDEKGPWREIRVEKFEVHSKGLVAKFPGCNDRNAAEKLKGQLVAIPRSSLPSQAEDEYYWADLIGLDVINLEGENLGKVSSLMDTGANQVLCVAAADGELLIPFIASAIQQVSLEERVIRVDWQADYLK